MSEENIQKAAEIIANDANKNFYPLLANVRIEDDLFDLLEFKLNLGYPDTKRLVYSFDKQIIEVVNLEEIEDKLKENDIYEFSVENPNTILINRNDKLSKDLRSTNLSKLSELLNTKEDLDKALKLSEELKIQTALDQVEVTAPVLGPDEITGPLSDDETDAQVGMRVKPDSLFDDETDAQVGMRVKTANTDQKFDFYLLPAMQSTFRLPAGRDTPNALPGGLNIRIRPNISKTRVPGSKPVYQNLGIDSVLVTIVGAFTGGNVTGKFFEIGTATNLTESGTKETQDSYRDYNEFLNLIDIGEELDVEINFNQGYSGSQLIKSESNSFKPFSPEKTARDYFNEEFRKRLESENDSDSEVNNADGTVKPKTVSYLRNKKGNPRFRGFLRDFQYAFVRNNLSYYVMQYEVTDFRDGLEGQAEGTTCVGYIPAKLLDLTTQFIETQTEFDLEAAIENNENLNPDVNRIAKEEDKVILLNLINELNLSRNMYRFVKSSERYYLVYDRSLIYQVNENNTLEYRAANNLGKSILRKKDGSFYFFELTEG